MLCVIKVEELIIFGENLHDLKTFSFIIFVRLILVSISCIVYTVIGVLTY